jgi:hypothetical protein
MARTSMRPIVTRMAGAEDSGAATRGSCGPRSRWPSGWGRTIRGATGGGASGGSGRSGVAVDSSVSSLESKEACAPGEGTGGRVSPWPRSRRVLRGRNTASSDSSSDEGGPGGTFSGNTRGDVDKASRHVGLGSARWSVSGRVSGGVWGCLAVTWDGLRWSSFPVVAPRSDEPDSLRWDGPGRDSGVPRGDSGVAEDRASPL